MTNTENKESLRTQSSKYSEAKENLNRPLLCVTWWTSQIWTAVPVARPSSAHRKRSLGRSRACAAYRQGSGLPPPCSSCLCLCRIGYAAGGMVHDSEPSEYTGYFACQHYFECMQRSCTLSITGVCWQSGDPGGIGSNVDWAPDILDQLLIRPSLP